MGPTEIAALLKPITEATFLGAILAGIMMGILYWQKIPVVLFNGFIFNFAFFTMLYTTRRFVNGVDSAIGYIGIFFLYVLFLISTNLTYRVLSRITKSKTL